jgi:hypothetical protein
MMTTGIDWLYQIEKYEDFANGPFEELWDYMSTPKNKLAHAHTDIQCLYRKRYLS